MVEYPSPLQSCRTWQSLFKHILLTRGDHCAGDCVRNIFVCSGEITACKDNLDIDIIDWSRNEICLQCKVLLVSIRVNRGRLVTSINKY